MTCLLGNTETRTVYRNFDLQNLHVNQSDRTHTLYNRYLCYNRFLPSDETRYFAHLATNTLAPDPGNTGTQKGGFNVFPIDLATDELRKSTSSSLGTTTPNPSPPLLRGACVVRLCERGLNFLPLCVFLGVVTTSPLKLEVQFEPVPELQWFLLQAYVYLCRIDFTGSKTNQAVFFDYL